MSSGDHLTVMLPVKGGAPEVYQTNLSVLYFPHVFPLQQCIVIFSAHKLRVSNFTSVLCKSNTKKTNCETVLISII